MRTCGECDASSSTKLQSKALIPLIRRHYVGPNGRLRASHREIAAENLDNLGEEDYRSLMGPAYFYHPHTSTQPLSKGEKVVNHNVGRHRVHTGGGCPSQVMVSVRRGFNELV
jgi:hypothetical protein